MSELYYFDNAATSWPKPAEVQEAVTRAISGPIGNPGRSGHRMSIAAAQIVLDAREAVAELFGVGDPACIALTKNATEALNLAILGLVRPGDHVVTTSMEHNSVMRPLRDLESQGSKLTVVRCAADGSLNSEQVKKAITRDTRLVVTTHASNVSGTLLPIDEIAGICREAGVAYLVDAAQSAGAIPIDVEALGIDLLALPGHKALLGPTGTGALYVREGLELDPITRGGTGSRSDEQVQPEFAPDRYESGTLNVVGLAGLAAGARYVQEYGIDRVREHDRSLASTFLEVAAGIEGCSIQGPNDPDRQVATMSFTLDGVSPSEIGRLLDTEFDVMCRVGLHCAPIAHRTLGTFPDGTVRFSWGMFNTNDEIAHAGRALREIRARALAARR